MEKNGLSPNDRFKTLTAAQSIFIEKETSSQAVEFSGYLHDITLWFSEAIVKKDIDLILDIENDLQRFDTIYAKDEKERDSIESLYKVQEDIEKAWNEGKSQEAVRKAYERTFKGKKPEELTPKQREDTGMVKLLNAKRRYLTKFALGTANAAEKALFLERKKALYLLQTEHQKNIDRALGHDMSKDKGLSR